VYSAVLDSTQHGAMHGWNFDIMRAKPDPSILPLASPSQYYRYDTETTATYAVSATATTVQVGFCFFCGFVCQASQFRHLMFSLWW
jgi:hypothetical protein